MTYRKNPMFYIKILSCFDEGKKTPTEVTTELDSEIHSVMNYMKDLREEGALERNSKSGRKQYYSIVPVKAVKFIHRKTVAYLEYNFENMLEKLRTD